MTGNVTIDFDRHVAVVRLDRPDKLNALDVAMYDALLAAGQQLAARQDVRCIVLTGAGRAFCAGIDLQRLGTKGDAVPPPRLLAARTHGIANLPQQVVIQWQQLAAPVIAAVHGVAFGAGLQLALGADMRYAAPGTRMSVMEVQWGLAPDMGGMALMRRLARDDVARELTYTGRIFLAEEALAYGLVTRVCDDPLSAALATAREIAEKSPHAVQAAKRLFNHGSEPELAEILAAESAEHDALVLHPNQREAVVARTARRNPHFGDPQ